MPTVSNSIDIAKISGYLSANDIAKKTALQNGSVVKRTPVLIFAVRRIIEKIYEKDSSYAGLQVAADYLYWLCGNYSLKAQKILNINITGSVATKTMAVNNIASDTRHIYFKIGDENALLEAGERVIVINDENILGGVEVHIDGIEIYPITQSDELSFGYTNTSTTITITLNQDAYFPQKYHIKYDVAATGSFIS